MLGGVDVQVVEAASVAGGVVRTERIEAPEGTYLLETGPNTWQPGQEGFEAAMIELGLESQRLDTTEVAKKRFIVRDGAIHAIPGNPLGFLFSPLMSFGGVMRVGLEPLMWKKTDDPDESIWDFGARHIGKEAADILLDAFVGGVYAGDAKRLSLNAAFPLMAGFEAEGGSIVRGAMAHMKRKKAARVAAEGRWDGLQPTREPTPKGSLASFRDGLGTLGSACTRLLGDRLHLETPARGLRRTGDRFLIETTHGTLSARRLVLATQAHVAADLVGEGELGVDAALRDDAAAALGEIPYARVALVYLGLPRESVTHPLDGFGFLTPSSEKRRLLGTLFSSTLFANRAPDGHVLLTTFVGGARRPDLVDASDDALVALVREELGELIGLQGPHTMFAVRRWERAIPQYEIGHLSRLRRVAALEAAVPGLHFAGSYRDGIAMAKCVDNGRALGRRLS